MPVCIQGLCWLVAGDVLCAIDGHRTAEMPLAEIMRLLQGHDMTGVRSNLSAVNMHFVRGGHASDLKRGEVWSVSCFARICLAAFCGCIYAW